jgi:hypothetical protein
MVRIWSAAAAPACLAVAVQYRAAKPYRLSEMEYLEMLRRAKVENHHPLFRAMLRGEPHAAGATRELANHWVPLLRLLSQQDRLFRSAVVACPDPMSSNSGPAGEAAGLLQRARQMEAEGQWLAALEEWTKLLRTGGPVRTLALFGRVTALQALGEPFLAERQLRGLFLYDPDEAVQNQALTRLVQSYTRAVDTEHLLALHAVEALRRPTPETLSALADALLAEGEYELALLAGLDIERDRRPVQTLLRAAYQVRWWRVYNDLIDQLATAEEQLFWHAQMALGRSHEEEALHLFRHAKALGQAQAASLEQGLAIRSQLASPDPAIRCAAIAAWEHWQANQPGPLAWREEAGLVVDYLGAESVYSIDRDLYARFYRTSPERPVRLQVAGPVRLRLEVRPVHPHDSTVPFDDWLTIQEPGLLRVIPVTDNYPAKGLTLVSDSTQVPGSKVLHEVELGPGLHEIAVAGETKDVLVRVFARRPEIPLGILPPLTRETLAAVMPEGSLITLSGTPAGAVSPHQHSNAPNRPGSVPPLEFQEAVLLAQGDLDKALALPQGEGDTAVLRRMTLLLRLAEKQPEQRLRALVLGEALFAANPHAPGLQELYTRLLRRSTWRPVTAVASSAGLRRIAVQGWAPESPALRTRTALLRLISPAHQLVSGSSRLVLTMNNLRPTLLLLELAMEDVEHLPAMPLTAVTQLDEEPESRLRFTARDARQTRGLLIPAGAHSVRVWLEQPLANQFLRVRMREVRPDLLAAEEAAALAGLALPALLPHKITVPLALNRGYQQLRPEQTLVRTTERSYQVATPDQPLQIRLEGPAWLCVEELRGETIAVHYQAVPPGWRTLEFKPQPGQREALFRVFQRVPAPDEPAILPRYVMAEPTPVPPPLIELRTLTVLPLVHTDEEYSSSVAPAAYPTLGLTPWESASLLGGPEDGIWSLTAGYQRRRPLDEDFNGLNSNGVDEFQRGQPDEFVELRATHRCFDEWRRAYWATDFLTRHRASGGPTFGLREHFCHVPDASPCTFHLEGSGYVQRPTEPLVPGTERTEWSLLLRGRVSKYGEITPKLSQECAVAVFGRLLSMDKNRYEPGHVDQDIFTPYKADHRAGLELRHTLVHQPWLDTEWWGQGALVTNEDFATADHLACWVGWRQLLGNVQVDATYRVTRFFNDTDRTRAATRQVLELDLFGDFGNTGRDWMELGVGWQHDLTRGVDSLNLYLTWHFGNGREFRDFRPGEVDFLGLRRRRAAQALLHNQVGLPE